MLPAEIWHLDCASPLQVKRKFYRNFYKAKKKAFSKYVTKYSDGKQTVEAELEELKAHATIIRVLAHTQIKKIDLGQKKAHLMEIQARAFETTCTHAHGVLHSAVLRFVMSL